MEHGPLIPLAVAFMR